MILDKKILIFIALAVSLSLSAQDNNDNPDADPAVPSENSQQAEPLPPQEELPPPPDQNEGQSNEQSIDPADTFRALREKRLEEARAYQEQELERQRIREEKERAEREAKLEAEREKYEKDKAAFLSQFKKKAGPTPTATPSVLDELDKLTAEGEVSEEEENDDASETDLADPKQDQDIAQDAE